VHAATALLTVWEPQPLIVVAPSLKLTVPLGLAPVTVAVNVTDCPTVDGFCDELRLVVVLAWTVCVRTGEVLAALFVSPAVDGGDAVAAHAQARGRAASRGAADRDRLSDARADRRRAVLEVHRAARAGARDGRGERDRLADGRWVL
jgi:hypothetical protein